jgi:uroporphyrinogen-III synthase
LEYLLEIAQGLNLEPQVRAALRDVAIASVGPVMTATLEAHGLPADIIPNHPKMGALVKAAAESAGAILSAKLSARRAAQKTT